MSEYLTKTDYYDFSHPVVQQFIEPFDETLNNQQKAIELYKLVRDGWRYDPYTFHITKDGFKASVIMQRSAGHCLDKAIILVASLRGVGLPARLHLAKVKNHIAVERMIEMLGSDELTPHGYVEVWLDDRWVSCTPAFNASLCERLGVAPLEFDGKNDSIFQAYNATGDQFMEYLEDYGHFEDFPYDFVISNIDEHYPNFKEKREGREVFRL